MPKENVWNIPSSEADWPGLAEARSVSAWEKLVSPSISQTIANNEVLSAINELKSALQDLAKRVEMLEKSKTDTENNSEKEVCKIKKEGKAESVNVSQPNQSQNQRARDVMEDVEYTDDVEGNNIKMSPKFILDMCREMKDMTDQLMQGVAKGNVSVTRGSATHALIKALSDSKYK